MTREETLKTGKPSEVLRIAREDFAGVLNNPKYVIDMDQWHLPTTPDPEEERKCLVCLAGSVMAGTLKAPIYSEFRSSSFDGMYRVFQALDDFREGRVNEFFLSITGKNADTTFLIADMYRYPTLGILGRSFPYYRGALSNEESLGLIDHMIEWETYFASKGY